MPPNILPAVIVCRAVQLPANIIAEATPSFPGVGILIAGFAYIGLSVPTFLGGYVPLAETRPSRMARAALRAGTLPESALRRDETMPNTLSRFFRLMAKRREVEDRLLHLEYRKLLQDDMFYDAGEGDLKATLADICAELQCGIYRTRG